MKRSILLSMLIPCEFANLTAVNLHWKQGRCCCCSSLSLKESSLMSPAKLQPNALKCLLSIRESENS